MLESCFNSACSDSSAAGENDNDDDDDIRMFHVLSGFYADSPHVDDGGRSTCDGPCALSHPDVGEPTICSVQRDHLTDVSSIDDQLSSGISPATLDGWPLTMLSSSGGISFKTVLGQYRLLLMVVTAASLPTRRCIIIVLGLIFFSINFVGHVRLIRCLPASFVHR